MPRIRKLTPGASPLHFFGSEVRRARTATGMTLAGLAVMVPCDQSTVSRIESGLLMPDLRFARACDEAFPHSDGWFTRFFCEAREWGEAFPREFRSFAQDEAEATALYVFEHAFIPGLLQTEDYARAVLSRHPVTSDDQVAERVKARLARQAVLMRADPPLLWSVIDEYALRRVADNSEVMRGQLAHLAQMARRPAITVQVLAADVHIGLQGAFNVAEIAGSSSPGTAYLEDAADGRIIQDAAAVGRLAVRFRHLQSEAMGPAASIDLIEQIAGQR
jgi:transcriptional regulator with XRE-family HTH domain